MRSQRALIAGEQAGLLDADPAEGDGDGLYSGIGEDNAVAFAGSQGNFELSAMRPNIINNFLHSAGILGDAYEKLAAFSSRARGSTASVLTRWLKLVSALSPVICYDKVSAIVHRANDDGVTLKEAAFNSATSTRSALMRSSTLRWWSGKASAAADPTVGALPFVLSLIAGSTDIIGFLGLNGLFTAHITGNIVVLTAHIVAGDPTIFSYILSVPVFMLVLLLTRLLAGGLERSGMSTLQPLLLVQLIFLVVFLVLCVTAGPWSSADTLLAIIAGMSGVSAMAVQNALVQISLKGSPTTAVMTTNVTHFMLDLGEALAGGGAAKVAEARNRAMRTPSGDRRLYHRLRSRRRMPSCRGAVVAGSAHRSRAARLFDGFGAPVIVRPQDVHRRRRRRAGRRRIGRESRLAPAALLLGVLLLFFTKRYLEMLRP